MKRTLSLAFALALAATLAGCDRPSNNAASGGTSSGSSAGTSSSGSAGSGSSTQSPDQKKRTPAPGSSPTSK